MRKTSCFLLLVSLGLLPLTAGCQRWGARLDSLRDERVAEIEHNLGMGRDSRSAIRQQSLPEFSDAAAEDSSDR